MDNLANALDEACLKFAKSTALIEVDREIEKQRLTYEQFRLKACSFSAQFKNFVKPGERIAIIMQNQSKWLISAFAAFRIGAVLVPIDYKLTTEEQLQLLNHAKPKLLITDANVLDSIKSANPSFKTLIAQELYDNQVNPDFKIEPKKKNDIACIVYSSGTAGHPKGCMMSHENYLEQADILEKLFPVDQNCRYFSILPTNHAIDFMCGFLIPIFFGASIVHQLVLRPQYILSTLQKYKITHIALVPLLLKAFAKKIQDSISESPLWKQRLLQTLIKLNLYFKSYSLSRILLWPIHQKFGGHLRLIFAGGGFVDPKTVQVFLDIGIPVIIGYGLTEACTVSTVNHLDDLRKDTVGKPIPGVKIELRNKNEDHSGEIWIKGATVLSGYWQDADLTKETLQDGWLRTGDIGWFDADGHLKLLGRIKNMIVTEGGKNIYPEDIESYFDAMEDCVEYAVFSKNFLIHKQALDSDNLLIVVRPKEGAQINRLAEAIKQRNLKLPPYKRLSGFIIHNTEFPRTASLKIKRQILAEIIRDQTINIEIRCL